MNRKYGIKSFAVLLILVLFATSFQKLPVSTAQAAEQRSVAAWNAERAYVGGERVSYQGNLYQAKWWTQGDVPGQGGEWGVWTLIGPDTEAPADPVDPTNPGDPADPGDPAEDGTVLTDAQINSLWGGLRTEFSPAAAEQRLDQYLSQQSFEELFPRRYGSIGWLETAPWWVGAGETVAEYYSYQNLKNAIKHIANIKYKIEYREGVTYAPKISILDKTTRIQKTLSIGGDFNASWNLSKPIITKIVDFGSFLAEGTENDKKREIAAFLANIAHETGGGWETAPGGMLAWGLYFNEETSYIDNTTSIGYVDAANTEFPAVAGKSYHGRGPIQLSWNYNYGLVSSILYQDKNVLLNNPEKVVEDGKLGFMTALLFWMTPQAPKASCHDIMAGNWTPTAADIAAGRTVACFGLTINVINGGYEAGKDESDYRIKRRAGHYRDITARNGANIVGEKLDTLGMTAW